MEQGRSPSDRELIKRAKFNDTNAFHQLHDRYKKRILNYVYRFLGNYALAEDVTQDTFMRIYENLDKYRPIGSVKGWIYTIASNLAKNKLRELSKGSEISLQAQLSDQDESFTLEDTLEDTAPGPDRIAENKGISRKVHVCIGKLAEKYREVIILCGIQGLSYKEAAEIIECSTHVVGVRLLRAREKLKELLEDIEDGM